MSSGRQNILVVDDTAANLRLLSGILSKQNYMVRPVPDGKLALSAAKAEPPDLILLDIMMPGMSGYEVCRYLKEDELTKDIPVIFLSAKTDVSDKIKAFALGGLDYITKPFQAEEVIARVETHLKISTLQKQLEQKNNDLTETLNKLKATQDQMILREKMAALGQLIAGVAHEINTPLGAIRASISNVTHAVAAALQILPALLETMSVRQKTDFFALVQKSQENNKRLSSREARNTRKILEKELAEKEISQAETIANFFVNMGVYQDIEAFLPLLKESGSIDIIQAANNLFMLQNNSKNIVTAVERASSVVTALRKYAHFDKTGHKIKANIPEGIELVLTLYHNHLKQGIEVLSNYEDIPEIFCYPDELNQVWTNIIHNAIQAMDGKGCLEIHVFKKYENIFVQFTDSGKGIPEDIQKNIFDPFFTTKGQGQGSGLGLDIVSRIIELHKGRIEVKSRPGKTVFTIILPVRDSQK